MEQAVDLGQKVRVCTGVRWGALGKAGMLGHVWSHVYPVWRPQTMDARRAPRTGVVGMETCSVCARHTNVKASVGETECEVSHECFTC